MLERAKRASHIDLPTSPGATMRRATPERGENSGPGKDFLESLTPGPELENDLDPSRPSDTTERRLPCVIPPQGSDRPKADVRIRGTIERN